MTAPADARRALARLLTQIENGDARAQAPVAAAHRAAGRAHVIGITGAPGTGKSTLVSALARAWRATGATVAILSIDPSSPLTGGAILGDRIRMRELSGDEGVFIRSMAGRGAQGGIAAAAADACAVLDAHGFDIVLVETIGAGQSETEVARLAHTVVLVEAPGMGDDVQAIKAGIVEIADIIVVNKSDRPGAEQTASALRAALDLAPRSQGHHGAEIAGKPETRGATGPDDWAVLVLQTTATQSEGISALLERIGAHRIWLAAGAQGAQRQARRSRDEIVFRLRELLFRRALARLAEGELEALAARVAACELSAAEAAQMIAER